jgi:hypothetical protein
VEDVPPPGGPTSYFTLDSRKLTTPAAGRLRVETAFIVSNDCVVSSITGAWFAVDGVYLPGSLIRFYENVTTTAVLSGLTASPLAAGEHTVEIRSGCLTETNNSTTFVLPSRIEATFLPGSSAVIAAAMAAPTGLSSRMCTMARNTKPSCG